jgi:hypothetical protein
MEYFTELLLDVAAIVGLWLVIGYLTACFLWGGALRATENVIKLVIEDGEGASDARELLMTWQKRAEDRGFKDCVDHDRATALWCIPWGVLPLIFLLLRREFYLGAYPFRLLK